MDEKIFHALECGGVEALTELFRSLRPNLRNLIERRISNELKQRIDASDILQDAFLKAQNGLDKFLISQRLRPSVWIRVLCKQQLLEVERFHFREKRSPELEVSIDSKIADRLCDSFVSECSRLVKGELLMAVQNLIQDLSQVDKEILEMRHIEKHAFKDIATVLNLTADAAKKRYYRSIEKIRLELKRLGQVPAESI